MKQIASLLTFMFCAALFLGFSGCGSEKNPGKPPESQPVVQDLDIKSDAGDE